MNEEVTAIFFSCRRLHLLWQTVNAFNKANTYPMKEIIIVNDSGEIGIHDELRKQYPDYTLVLHPENVGLMKSIDLGYVHIKTNYFFHCEDDWSFLGNGGFIEKSLTIMQQKPEIEEVWLKDMNKHQLEPTVYSVEGVQYRIAASIFHAGSGEWHGFATACGLKRIEDYRKVAPYADIPYTGTVWHRECAIGNAYFKLGYRTAVLTEEYVHNIGYGQSEYKTGFER